MTFKSGDLLRFKNKIDYKYQTINVRESKDGYPSREILTSLLKQSIAEVIENNDTLLLVWFPELNAYSSLPTVWFTHR